jgi:S-adenosylmethionine hydrolase
MAEGSLQGEVISVDKFGNAITNLVALRPGVIEINGTRIPLRRTYADASSGDALAVVGSSGLIEIAVRDGSAAQALGLARGSMVLFRPLEQKSALRPADQ